MQKEAFSRLNVKIGCIVRFYMLLKTKREHIYDQHNIVKSSNYVGKRTTFNPLSHSGTARVPPMYHLFKPLSKMFYCIFWSEFLYSGVFGVAQHESVVILTEFKMADPRLLT